MVELNNVCRILAYKDDMDLYRQLDGFMNHKVGIAKQCIRLREMKILENNKVLVYLEPDFNVVEVHFFSGNERIYFEDSPTANRFMTMEQITFINQNGEIKIDRTTYAVEEVKYCIDSVGISYVEIYLSKESEEED